MGGILMVLVAKPMAAVDFTAPIYHVAKNAAVLRRSHASMNGFVAFERALHEGQKMPIKFVGDGPFYLQTIEHGAASALADTIQLTLHAHVEGRGDGLVQIETQMTPDRAECLANALIQAIKKTASDRLLN